MIPPEEAARANFYALLARLFYAPPDAPLLKAIATETMEGDLAGPWSDLAKAAAQADPEAVREEYETAFIGTGKAPVTLYTSAYTIRYSSEVPLAALRGELAALGLARRAEAREPEDHIAALCDTMRHLVAEQKNDLDAQRRFFSRWIAPAVEPLCSAIERSDKTAFYKPVARFAKSFLLLEQAAFEMI
ncbi:MAG: TorD/DmsD family molecular chaperone [Burkholderiales bacterium]